MKREHLRVNLLVTPTTGRRSAQPGVITQVRDGRALVSWTEPGGNVDWPSLWYDADDLQSRER